MDQNASDRSGRAELVAALDSLCLAVNQLIDTAKTKLPAQRHGRTRSTSASLIDELDPETSIVPDRVEFQESIQNGAAPGVPLLRPLRSEQAQTTGLIPADMDSTSIAQRVVDLQQRLGGFLK